MIVFILIYVVLIAWITHRYVKNTKIVNGRFETREFDAIKFRTGDLVLFRYEYFDEIENELTMDGFIDYNMMLVSLYDSWPLQFSHVGMIMVINGMPYIIQAANYPVFTHSKKCLSHKMDLYNYYEYVDNYHGNVYHVPYIGPELDNMYVYRSMKFVQQLPFKYDINTYVDAMSRNNNSGRLNKSITCSSGVLYMLNLIKIINEPNDNYNRHSPGAVFTKAMNTGLYSNPIITKNKWIKGLKTRDVCSPALS